MKQQSRISDFVKDPRLLTEGEVYIDGKDMVGFSESSVSFHLRRSVDKNVNYDRDHPDVRELLSRLAHLIDKFEKLCVGNEKTLFVIKLQNKEIDTAMITNLYFTLKEKYESGKFALLCIA